MTTQPIRSEKIQAKDRCVEVILLARSVLHICANEGNDKPWNELVYEQIRTEQDARLQLPPGIEIRIGNNRYHLVESSDAPVTADGPEESYNNVILPVGLGVRFLNGCSAFLAEERSAVINMGTAVFLSASSCLFPTGSTIRLSLVKNCIAEIVLNHSISVLEKNYRAFDAPSRPWPPSPPFPVYPASTEDEASNDQTVSGAPTLPKPDALALILRKLS